MRFPAPRVLLAGGLALAGVLSLSIPSQAVSVCQKKNRIKLRFEGCKAKETELGTVAFQDGELPPAPNPDPDPDPQPDPQPPTVDLSGFWRAFEQKPADDSQLSRPGREIELLDLREDGRGRIHQSDVGTGLVRCTDLVYTRGDEFVVDQSGEGEDTSVWMHELAGDELRLEDAAGASATFARRAGVDPEVECRALVEQRRFEGLPPANRTGLAFDGSLLYYNADNLVQPVAAFGGELLEPTDISSFRFIHADGGGALWGECGCGAREDVARTTLAGVQLNAVDIEALLGISSFRTNAIASDPATERLWVQGSGRLVEIDTSTTGGALLSERPFETSLTGMAFDGTDLWIATSREAIGRYDLEEGRVVESFDVPDPEFELEGIAVSGTELFLLGNIGESGAILVVTAP